MRRLILSSLVFVAFMAPKPAAQVLPHNIPFLCAGSADNVPAGQTVTLTGAQSKGCIEIPNGSTLRLVGPLTLTATTIQGLPGSRFEVSGDVTVNGRDVAPNLSTDPEQYGTGLVILGDYDIRGTASTSWAWMTAPLAPGATTASVESAAGVTVGSEACFGESRFVPDSATENLQCVTVTSVTGGSFAFTPSNQVERRPILNRDGSVYRFAPVAFLKRSIVFRSANPNGTRWHSLFTGSAAGVVDGSAFLDMGRTTNDTYEPGSQQPGRYAVHFHHNGGPGTFSNSTIRNARKWGLSVHQSSNKLVQNNVVVSAFGWGLGTEDGINETNVTFDRNLIIDVKGNGNRGDQLRGDWRTNPLSIGRSNVGIWLARPDVTVTNNVVMNTTIACQMIWGERVTPLAVNRGNTCFSSRRGYALWDVAGGALEDFVSSNTWFAVDNYATKDITYRRWTVRGDPAIRQGGGYSSGDYSTMGNVIEEWDVQNVGLGVWAAWAVADEFPGTLTTPRVFVVQNSTFCNNGTDIAYFPHAGSRPDQQKPLHTTIARNNAHCDQSPLWVSATGGQQNSLDPVPVFEVENFNRVVGDNFRVYSIENAPAGSTTRARVADRITGGAPPPPPPPPLPSVSTITLVSGPTSTPDGTVTQFRSVESPNWQTALWGTDTHLFNVVVKPGSGALPVTLVLHGHQNGAPPPGTFWNSNAPGIYIFPVDLAYEGGLLDPLTGTARGASRWMGYKDSAGVFQPVTAERVVRYVQWALTQTARWTADPNRVYVAGGSMGGGGAQKIALLYPNLFAAGVSATGWVDLAAWTPGSSDCQAGVRWKTANGPLCVNMHDSVYLVQNPQGRKVPLFLTWNSDDGTVSPARYPALLAALETASQGYRAEWRLGDHQFFLLPDDPQLAVRLDVAPTVGAATGTATSQPTGTRTNLGGTPPPPPPPPPTMTATYAGTPRDAVSPTSLTSDGTADQAFTVTFPASTTVTRFRVVSSVDGGWDTDTTSMWWIVGVSTTPTGALITTGLTSQAFSLFVSEGGSPRFPAGSTATITAWVGGATVTATATIGSQPPPPPPPPVDCQVSAWSAYVYTAWSTDGGSSPPTESRTGTRTRTVTTQPANGGQACPSLTETVTETRQIVTTPAPVSIVCEYRLTWTVVAGVPVPAVQVVSCVIK